MGRGILTGRASKRDMGKRMEGDTDTKGMKEKKNRMKTERRFKSLAVTFQLTFYSNATNMKESLH
jgi:hypothetical protein